MQWLRMLPLAKWKQRSGYGFAYEYTYQAMNTYMYIHYQDYEYYA